MTKRPATYPYLSTKDKIRTIAAFVMLMCAGLSFIMALWCGWTEEYSRGVYMFVLTALSIILFNRLIPDAYKQ